MHVDGVEANICGWAKSPYHSSMSEQPPVSVGLGGDGDEIAAMQDVEAAFGVRLDDSDASNWLTAGDVYRALRRALPADEAAKPDLWDRFAEALTRETGVDPKSIRAESTLLAPESRLWARLHDAHALLWLPVVISLAIGIGLALLSR
jgi:hypothetical protein